MSRQPRAPRLSAGTTRLARWCATHPWRAVVLWLVFVAAAVALGSSVPTKQVSDADLRVGEAGRAQTMVADHGLAGKPSEVVLVQARTGTLDRAEAARAGRELGRRFADDPVVSSVAPAAWSRDGTALLVSVDLRPGTDGDDPDVTSLQRATRDVQRAHPDLRVRQTGDSSLDTAINDHVAGDLAQAEKISLPVTLLVMLVAFGALVAAGIPVLLAISGVLATIALYGPVSHLVPGVPTVANMVLLIGMAVGVDYSLFYLKRHREERARGLGPVDAVEVAAATSGHAVVVSGAAVVVAMAGLYLVGDPTFASLATGAILVVAVSVLGSLTVLPALLALLGHRVDRGRVPFARRLTGRPGGALATRLLGPALRHPVAAVLVSLLALGALALPALGLRMGEGNLDTLPRAIPEVQTMKAVAGAFPSQGEDVSVVVRTGSSGVPTTVRHLEALRDDAVATGGFAPGASTTAVQVSPDRGLAVLTLPTRYAEGSAANGRLLDRVRDDLVPRHLGSVPSADRAVGGSVAEDADYSHHQSAALPWVIGAVLLLTLLVVGATFRSVAVALLTTALNLLSVGAAFGVLVLVFQESWGASLLGVATPGFVVDWIPLFLFVVLIGLSMDYHVFVLSRVREGLQRGLPPRLAVQQGIVETAGTVTSAAAVMVSVFAIFAGLSMVELQQIGVGLAVAVLVDATLVRVVLLPALLSLLGRAAWWPSTPAPVALTPVHEPTPVPVG